MKLKKSQIKELIRHTIVDLTEKTFGSKAQYDAYRKKHNLKPGSKHKVDGKTVTVRDVKKISKSVAKSADKFAAAQNAKLDAAEKAMKKKKVKESKMKRYTVKEVRMWMKKLEENRYKKVYNSDARRVAWMVNNEGVELSEMPKSMSKKWTKAQYGRERYLATEFLKSKSEQMNERKLTEKVKYKKDKKIGGEWYTKQGTHKHQMKANIIAKREFGRYYDTEVVKEKGGYTIYVKPLKEEKLTETKFYAFFNKKKHTIDGKSLYDAKQKAILKLKIPKSKVGMLSIVNAKEHDRGGFRFEQKLREQIREIIKEQMNLNEYIGAGKPIPRNKAKHLFVPENQMIRFSRVFKKLIQKGFVYIGDQTKEKKKISKHYTITVDKKMYNNLLDILMSKNFKVKT